MRHVVRHQVAVVGRVVDGVTGRPLSGVRVELATTPAALQLALEVQRIGYGAAWDLLEERTDRKRTDAAGRFSFLDVPSGKYGLAASLPGGGRRYGQGKGRAVVKRDRAGNVDAVWVELKLPATSVAGKVTGPGSQPVPLAAVRVDGDPAPVYTNDRGQYLFTGIESGTRTIIVSARGFGPAEQQVVVASPGSSVTCDVTFKPTKS